ncbi:MAG: GDP-mannose mannosyl hydrolase [Nevskia sp.]|nr:GDP-mannose mannosyl hydrolase [Nevskia sp.]
MASSPAAERPAPARLPRQEFLEVVERAPLVSIDLIVRDSAGRVLLGLRRNMPARGWWFVPGGCVRKNETLDAAFERITFDELGATVPRAEAQFLGVFEHFYEDNAGDLPGFGTHYVVLGHALPQGMSIAPPPDQHSEYRWLAVDALLADSQVHEYTKAYFRGPGALKD